MFWQPQPQSGGQTLSQLPQKPRREDYDDYEEYIEALEKYNEQILQHAQTYEQIAANLSYGYYNDLMKVLLEKFPQLKGIEESWSRRAIMLKMNNPNLSAYDALKAAAEELVAELKLTETKREETPTATPSGGTGTTPTPPKEEEEVEGGVKVVHSEEEFRKLIYDEEYPAFRNNWTRTRALANVTSVSKRR